MNPDRSESAYPLSPVQMGMLFHYLKEPHAGTDIEQLVVSLAEAVDVDLFRQAWQQLLARHSALRTAFNWQGLDAPQQTVANAIDLPFTRHDLRRQPSAEQQQIIDAELEWSRREGFNLSQPPLLRVDLFQLSDTDYRCVWTIHHILIDGRCFPLLLEELFALYHSLRSGQPAALPAPAPFREYVGWLERQNFDASQQFWRNNLQGFAAATPLTVDRARPGQPPVYASQEIWLSETLTEELRTFSGQQRLSLYTLVLGAWTLLLHRYSGHTDILVGTTLSCRQQTVPNAEAIIGPLINTVPVRSAVSPQLSVEAWLRRLRDHLLQLRRQGHIHVPLVDIQSWSDVPAGQPLFESLVVFENYLLEQMLCTTDEWWAAQQLELLEQTGYPLTLNGYAGPELALKITYNQARFDADTIGRMLGHLQTLLTAMARQPQQAIAHLPLLTAAERRQILETWNDTGRDYPQDRLVYHYIEEQARQIPQAIAVEFEGRHLTYTELNRRANQLAHALRSLGVGPDSLVPIAAERSLELVIGLLAIVKAGGAYLPIDPAYPAERIAAMLAQAQAAVLLTQAQFAPKLPAAGTRVLCLDIDWAETIAPFPGHNPPGLAAPENLAYTIFTSGSSGQPKGVMNTHRGLLNRLLWMQSAYRLTAADRVLQKTPFTFDVSVWEFFWPLMVGARLVVARPNGHKDNRYLLHTIQSRKITTVHFVPSMLRLFLDTPGAAGCDSLRQVFASGEALPIDVQRRFFEQLRAKLHNLYGPTEAAIDVSYWECDPADPGETVPIGRPVANTQLFILDEHLEPVPVGVPGQLHIGGVQLARGYLNRPVLTGQKFIANPFIKKDEGGRVKVEEKRADSILHPLPPARGSALTLYKTGDLARFRSDGVIEYLGRLDDQLKIRGVRVEPAEIEAALARHPAVAHGLVTGHNSELVAYLVPRNHTTPTSGQLRSFLADILPAEMIPSVFVPLPQLPLLPNGKIDRRALPAPSRQPTGDSEPAEPPQTATEVTLANIWANLLAAGPISRTDNFFDLGGHSLKAIQLVSRLNTAFGIDLPLQTIFDAPTLAQLAGHIDAAPKMAALALCPLPRTGALPLSFAQQGLWFVHQLNPSSPAYHIVAAYTLTGPLAVPALEHSLTTLAERHETLRTVFVDRDGTPAQQILPPQPVSLPADSLAEFSAEQQPTIARRRIAAESFAPFNLARGPLWRVGLLQLAPNAHILYFIFHHIIFDGWSLAVFQRELAALYQAHTAGGDAALPALAVQYADIAAWQRNLLDSSHIFPLTDFWAKQLAGAPGQLSLPISRQRPPTQTFNGRRQPLQINADLADALRHLARRHNATLFATLLAAFKVLLFRYTDQTDLVVGVPAANRSRPELEHVIGLLVNMLPVRSRFAAEATFAELLQTVRDSLRTAQAHQDLPFEKVVEILQPARTTDSSPLFQITFTLQDAADQQLALPELAVTPLPIEPCAVRFDLELYLWDTPTGLSGHFVYNTDLFDPADVARLAVHFERLLAAFADNPALPVAGAPLLSPTEELQLRHWNDTAANFAGGCVFHRLFEAQVERAPEAVAVVCAGEQVTYRQLNQQANRLARHLQMLGVGPETPVGLCAERSVDMVTGLLAILKAGGAYVPLDPAYPAGRLDYILANTAIPVVLTQPHLRAKFSAGPAAVAELQPDAGLPADNLPGDISPQQLAYILYTSGSTGQPKGAMIEQQALGNLIHSLQQVIYARHSVAPLRITVNAPLAFDASIQQLGMLAYGHTLVVVPQAIRHDGGALLDFLKQQQIDGFDCVPSQLKLLLAAGLLDRPGWRPKLALVGGEAIDPHTWQQLRRATATQFYNMYGLTECAVDSVVCHINAQSELPVIGRPLPNTTCHIVDRRGQPLPVGVPGELHLGGAGLARGYINRPHLTAEKFIPNPFIKDEGGRQKAEEKRAEVSPQPSSFTLYKTGDLARYRPDGSIEFLGRLDHQLKLRGYRIEPGEIEAALQSHPGVKTAVVTARQERLEAYILPGQQPAPTPAELRAFLKQKLPDFMIPGQFIPLAALPLTPNGKIDRHRLPAAPASQPPPDSLLPQNPLEKAIALVWADVLELRQVGLHENFFDLGGHSLLATRLITQLRQVFNIDIPLRCIFEAPTVAEFAAAVTETHPNPAQLEKIARLYNRIRAMPASVVQQALREKRAEREKL